MHTDFGRVMEQVEAAYWERVRGTTQRVEKSRRTVVAPARCVVCGSTDGILFTLRGDRVVCAGCLTDADWEEVKGDGDYIH